MRLPLASIDPTLNYINIFLSREIIKVYTAIYFFINFINF